MAPSRTSPSSIGGHDYHHFVGLVRETLVATFAVVAHNFHVPRTWRAKLALTAPRPKRLRQMKRLQPVVTTPPKTNGVAKPRGPKGLELLATPRAGP